MNTTNIQDIPAGPRRTVVEQIQRKVRDARFRKNVLAAYAHRCAASDIQLDLLDAAHIVPVEHERRTDEMKNGLCLSALHHRAFDHGLLGIKRNHSIVFHEENFIKLRAIGWDGGENAFRDSCREPSIFPHGASFILTRIIWSLVRYFVDGTRVICDFFVGSAIRRAAVSFDSLWTPF